LAASNCIRSPRNEVVKSGVLLVFEKCAGRNKKGKSKIPQNFMMENDPWVINRP
jgi:hypothetical protein